MPDARPAITRPFRFDVDELTRLLHEAGVSSEGMAEHLDDYLVARTGERIVGVVLQRRAGEHATGAPPGGVRQRRLDQPPLQPLAARGRRHGERL